MNRYVEVPGGRLYVAEDGEGPAIVLVHAAIANLHAWDPMVPGLVAAGLRAIRYDARGFGLSTTEDVAFSNRGDLRAVLDATGTARAALVGNSRGGAICVDTAIESPERVAAVVTVGSNISGFEPEPTPAEAAIFAEGERLEASSASAAEKADFEVRLWVDGPGQPADRVPEAIRESVREMDLELYEPGRQFGRPIPLEPRAVDRLADLRCPVLALAGDLDVSDVAATARHLEAHAPEARARILPGLAHMIGLEAPELLTQIVVEFLTSIGWLGTAVATRG